MSASVRLEITTNVYDKPLVCNGIKDEGVDYISYDWEEHRENEKPCRFKLKVFKKTKLIELKRMGEMTSVLVFEQGKRTKGSFVTPFGEMELTIETDYINLPNVFNPKLEFAYRMLENSEMDKNTFAIKEV
ncbi:MAG: DUF1934 domain-containing protein [Clostridia bacterium]|nr:DUF1934 domain-containing protein [Clostridia bacterium]